MTELLTSSEPRPRALGTLALKAALLAIALGLLGLVVWLFAYGASTGFLGLREYPYTAKHGAVMAGHRIDQEIRVRLFDNVDAGYALTDLPWEKLLTHWHSPDDVTLESIEIVDGKIVAGSICFKAVNEEGAFRYDLTTRKLEPGG